MNMLQGLMTMTLICLAIIFGMSVAALVGGYRKYMFYRTDTLPNGFKYRTWYAHMYLMHLSHSPSRFSKDVCIYMCKYTSVLGTYDWRVTTLTLCHFLAGWGGTNIQPALSL